MRQKEHLAGVRPVKEVNALVRHLKHESGFYGVFISDLDNYIYIGYSADVLNCCKDLVSKAKQPGSRVMANYMSQFAFMFDKIPVKPIQIEIDRFKKHLELIYQYKTFPVQFNGHGFNFINPVTRQRFKRGQVN